MAGPKRHEQFREERERNERAAGGRRKKTRWLLGCICGETGKPLPILANVLLGLRTDWSGLVCLRRNARSTVAHGAAGGNG